MQEKTDKTLEKQEKEKETIENLKQRIAKLENQQDEVVDQNNLDVQKPQELDQMNSQQQQEIASNL